MLSISNISKSFGGIKALNNVSLNFEKGHITALIGPNGAGKTTLFNVINGSLKPDTGKVCLNTENITGLEPHQLFSKGVLRTFQISQEFQSLTVLDNLMMVPSNQIGESILNSWLKPKEIKNQELNNLKKAKEVIKFLSLDKLTYEYAGNLSGGQKKLLELGRTMMVEPKIVLLDEVGAGVNKTLLKKIGDTISRLNKELNYTFVMIEHDLDFISRLCNPIVVMAEGSILKIGKINEIKNDHKVIEVYLGKGN
ncbi:MAG: ABC transporter ATP-binding protein [SAR116 cluster bacterium]|jgi:branched-chain amino acid transport system ATP-binding protein|nr:ABC transporter ATP-binding protein [SAR116 cluster bacterium]|tara:strand:+ start:405 stop:1163 length:759 start_codon:yes stop_codon:yes gene_type:complete